MEHASFRVVVNMTWLLLFVVQWCESCEQGSRCWGWWDYSMAVVRKGDFPLITYWNCSRDGVCLPIGDHGVCADSKMRLSSPCGTLFLCPLPLGAGEHSWEPRGGGMGQSFDSSLPPNGLSISTPSGCNAFLIGTLDFLKFKYDFAFSKWNLITTYLIPLYYFLRANVWNIILEVSCAGHMFYIIKPHILEQIVIYKHLL